MFTLSIFVPEFIKMDQKPKEVTAKFATKEEWEEYKRREMTACEKEFVKSRGAWSDEGRSKAFSALYHARLNFYNKYFKLKQESAPKELA